jgi:membrane-bound lytic murein transglycosylase D
MRKTFLLTMLALYSVACASSSGGVQASSLPPSPAPEAGQRPAPHVDLDPAELRAELEDAYARVVSRAEIPAEITGTVPANIPVVDIEAAASIPIPQHRTIDSALRLFTVDMKDSIQTSLIRSGRYRDLIDKALAEEKLPKGLAYLPVIESAYLPTLTSSAGAHGIWQFMPETAREYGLRVDWWVDERADPERSTRAAASYLKDLHRMFDGDWALALAAYNCGPNRVRRKLEENGATTFWELLEAAALPKETRGYVPTFFATLLIASDPATYGFELGESKKFEDKRVDVRGPVSLEYIAEAIGVDDDLLKELNPALRRGVVPPGRASVRVPANAAETLAARADSLRHEDAYMKFCTFTVRDGDSVKRLAKAIGTKPETILAMNNLDENDRLRKGESIYLPVRARELGALLAHSSKSNYFHTVRKGDTLYSIAKQNGLTVAELRDLNDLSQNASLKPGQKIRVAAPATSAAGGM